MAAWVAAPPAKKPQPRAQGAPAPELSSLIPAPCRLLLLLLLLLLKPPPLATFYRSAHMYVLCFMCKSASINKDS